MPWPFRKRKEATGAAPPSSPRAITAADLAAPRLAVPVPRAWATLPPITRTVTTPSATLAAPQASFVHDVAGTQTLIQAPVLRAIVPEGPAGRADDIVAAGRSLPQPRTAPDVVEGTGAHDAPRGSGRSVAARPRGATGPRLDVYEGALRPYERPEPSYADFEPEAWADEPAEDVDGIPEELPPPIFSAILAERTGKSLAELRPDLADADGNIVMPEAPSAPTPGQRRRRVSPSEMRRMGLGAPMHSDEAADVDPSGSGTSPSGLPESEGDAEFVEETVSVEEFFAAAQVSDDTLAALAALAAAAEAEPEPEAEAEAEAAIGPEPDVPPGERRPTLRFRAAPGAPARRMPGPHSSTLRQTVPTAVREAVTRATGVDPGETSVRRGPDASVESTRIGASAFVRDGEIFLPAEHGPLDAPHTRALLAHELTHVVQHRVYGDRLPRPDSRAGRRLEAEARSVQRWVAGVDDAPRLPPTGTAGVRAAAAEFAELRETADELVSSGLAHWAPDGSLVFGSGAMGPMGEPWMAVPSDLHEAIDERDRLFREMDEQLDAGHDATEASRAYVDYQREFQDQHGAALAALTQGTGTGTGTTTGLGGAKSAEDMKKQLEAMDEAHAASMTTSPLQSFEASHGSAGIFGGPLFGDPRVAAAQAEEKDFQKKRQELVEKMQKLDKDRTEHRESAHASRADRAQQGLIHAPGGSGVAPGAGADAGAGAGAGAVAGAVAGGAGATDAEAKTEAAKKALTESQILEQEMKDQTARWKMEDELAKLDASRPVDLSKSWEETHPGGIFNTGGGGGVGGFFSGLFSDPRQAQAQQEEQEYQQKRERLETQYEQQKKIEAARKEEQQQAKAEQQAKKDASAKKDGGPVKETAADKKATAPTPAREEAQEPDRHDATVATLLSQMKDEEVEDLANLLYGRLVTRLRRDLIVDRERSGLLTDFR